MGTNTFNRKSNILITTGLAMQSQSYPDAWYLLWVVIAFCGVATWFMRNFTERREATRLIAFTGVAAMLVMVIWTFSEF
ncbi:MAG: hypothetical protein DWC08_00035 [Candidatus Poseidoniales archaeon]|nr:MAG: hypothetical protein DWC08_00035 [Candidatus Poseidoniales archaeon]